MAKKGPSHLAQNPPYFFGFLFCFVLLFVFVSLLGFRRKPFFPQKRVFLLIFQCLPLLLPSYFHPPSSLSLSLSLSLSFSRYFRSFFLPCFLSLFIASLSFDFISCLVSLFLFHEKQHQNIKLESLFSSIFSVFVFLFPVLLHLSNPFSCLCFILLLSCGFL